MFSVNDPRGKLVILKKNTWDKHIVDKRPELIPYLENVKNAIIDPDEIRLSTKSNNHEFYLRRSGISSGSFKNMNIAVVVEFVIRKLELRGYVNTAYITPEMKGGTVRWTRH